MTTPLAVEIEGLSKRFGETLALDDVSISIAAGRTHALLGGNGSGKSTLIKILAGVYTGEEGRLVVNGSSVDAKHTSPQWARAAGLRFVHQELGLFLSLTVAENICLTAGYDRRSRVAISWGQVERRTREILDTWKIAVRPHDLLQNVRPADRAMIAIARALTTPLGANELSAEPDKNLVIVLDEPTSNLPDSEVDRLLDWLRQATKQGATVILVTHRLEEVLAVADDVTVLRDGKYIATRPITELDRKDLVELIAPGTQEEVRAHRNDADSASSAATRVTRLKVSELSGGPLRNVSFEVAPGEIVGIAGLLGTGRTRLLQYIAGVERPDSGEIILDGELFQSYPQRNAVRAGIALVPESRADDGLLTGLSVAENIEAGDLAVRPPTALSLNRGLKQSAAANVKRFGVKTARVTNDIGFLSGGNQQKVLMARWLARSPKLVLLDEPTVGVDIGARQALHQLVRDSTTAGASALCVSSDLYELTALCDRILVLRDGSIAESFAGEEMTAREVGIAIHATTSGEVQ